MRCVMLGGANRPCAGGSASWRLPSSCLGVSAEVHKNPNASQHHDAPDHADPHVPAVVQVCSVGSNDRVCKAQQQRNAAHILMRKSPPVPASCMCTSQNPGFSTLTPHSYILKMHGQSLGHTGLQCEGGIVQSHTKHCLHRQLFESQAHTRQLQVLSRL